MSREISCLVSPGLERRDADRGAAERATACPPTANAVHEQVDHAPREIEREGEPVRPREFEVEAGERGDGPCPAARLPIERHVPREPVEVSLNMSSAEMTQARGRRWRAAQNRSGPRYRGSVSASREAAVPPR